VIPRWWRWAALIVVVLAAGTFVLDRMAASETAALAPPQPSSYEAVVYLAVDCPAPPITAMATPPWVSHAPWAPSILGGKPTTRLCNPDCLRQPSQQRNLAAALCDIID
jgi:hypothetical protein